MFENESSENNLNYLCQTKSNGMGLKCQQQYLGAVGGSNLTNHVNTLFDQWLSNSSHSSPSKNCSVKQIRPMMNQWLFILYYLKMFMYYVIHFFKCFLKAFSVFEINRQRIVNFVCFICACFFIFFNSFIVLIN